MRTDNRNVKNIVVSIYFILFVITILLATVFNSYSGFPINSMYVFVGLFVIIILVHFVARYFEYNSDGPKLIIINKGFILTDFINYRQNKLEFSKSRLIGYKVNNYFIYKTLVISIKGRNNGKSIRERFNITLLKRKKLRYIKQSLKKIIKENIKHIQG